MIKCTIFLQTACCAFKTNALKEKSYWQENSGGTDQIVFCQEIINIKPQESFLSCKACWNSSHHVKCILLISVGKKKQKKNWEWFEACALCSMNWHRSIIYFFMNHCCVILIFLITSPINIYFFLWFVCKQKYCLKKRGENENAKMCSEVKKRKNTTPEQPANTCRKVDGNNQSNLRKTPGLKVRALFRSYQLTLKNNDMLISLNWQNLALFYEHNLFRSDYNLNEKKNYQ